MIWDVEEWEKEREEQLQEKNIHQLQQPVGKDSCKRFLYTLIQHSLLPSSAALNPTLQI